MSTSGFTVMHARPIGSCLRSTLNLYSQLIVPSMTLWVCNLLSFAIHSQPLRPCLRRCLVDVYLMRQSQ